MPRKYHRPPDTTKRRKTTTRKPILPASAEAPSENGDAAMDEGVLEAPITAVSVADPEPEAEDSPRLRGILRTAAARSAASATAERHVGRDYSYVLGDVVRIGVIATFLFVSLAITAILR